MSVARVKTSAGWEDLSKVGPVGPTGYDTAPIGSAIYWTGTDGSIPDEWALCNGQRLYRAQYPDAYTYAQQQVANGNPLWTYRTSDESFTVPNFVSKFIYGKAAGPLPSMPTTGEETHVLTVGESSMKDHRHFNYTENHYHNADGGLTTGGHSHGISGSGTASATGFGTVTRAAGSGTTETPGHTHPVSISGGSDAPGNLGVYGNVGWSAQGGLDSYTGWDDTISDGQKRNGPIWDISGQDPLTGQGGRYPQQPATAHNNMPPYVIAAIIVKVRGVRILYDAIVGPMGPQGPVGPAGSQGDQGIQGVRGPQGSPLRVTSLPTAPLHDDEIIFVADATNGILWHLRYNGSTSSPYKWEFVGGPPLYAEVLATVSTSVGAYTALAGGPAITLPLAGDYDVAVGAHVYTAGANYCFMSYDIGSTGAVNADGIEVSDVTTDYDWHERTRRKTGLLAGITLTCKYAARGNSTTQYWHSRSIRVLPVRLGSA